jgi:hypothetical protein
MRTAEFRFVLFVGARSGNAVKEISGRNPQALIRLGSALGLGRLRLSQRTERH